MTQGKPTVLCVQTRNGRLEETAHVLADAGFEVIGTASADCALEFTSRRRVNGVMIDMFLREPEASVLRDEMRRILPGVPVLLFHGGHLLKLEVEILSAWIHRAERDARYSQDEFARALTEYTVGDSREIPEAEPEPALSVR